ncbi:hypothetical protein LCGC14_2010560, partial [marine sediment metagenome]
MDSLGGYAHRRAMSKAYPILQRVAVAVLIAAGLCAPAAGN